MRRSTKLAIAVVVALTFVAAAVLFYLGLRHDEVHASQPTSDAVAQIERGRYLAVLGDCQACHTLRGGQAYAGGRGTPTPFGTFYSPNLTPDAETGLGNWSADDFWLALHEGRSKNGKLLYPVFPYTNYTKITRADSDALFAYLRSLPAVRAPAREHELRFPYRYRALLIAWRGLFFRPGVFEADDRQSELWNRGAYLVQGLGHCSACHEARNALGAVRSSDNPSGGLVLSWYAPSLHSVEEGSVADWSEQDVIALLGAGKSRDASVSGPMAEVVFESLQHASEADLRAMATYLRALPKQPVPPQKAYVRVPQASLKPMMERGADLYRRHCADCHGDAGEGHAPVAPALAGNRALSMSSAVNSIRIIRFGGYEPGTEGNPRPFGMPPFGTRLGDDEIADVLTFIRASWGNHGRPVSETEVREHRNLDRQ
ncbi:MULTISPECIES: cytochrome c [Hydrocarboniphaga]|uniref:Cytochrome c n=1 Tax=Hydrocarboniphaga effusa AP103 TaxID=1172194 RepID=I7Z884_9GAMM|nr:MULTISPECIES: cytochrome c [Hydrocarboniphaga]EIT67999.1 cytochrome c [Hydrocarboniphaga effusa AP103]MDZ4080149.1 cytochrome c [Hydrocarboniphaga sp.]